MHPIETEKLTKLYGKTKALRELDFTLDEGEIMVLLGPNGSGKTTLLLILSTVLKPTSGKASVMGFDVVNQSTKVRQVLGISFQDARGFWRHKPIEILQFHATICGVPRDKRETLIEEILKDLELWDARGKLFMHLSGGQAKRLEVAKILVQRPKLAIFDEPSSQVDLRGKRIIWDHIRKLREDGSTILVATNEVREAEYLADRITILDKGVKVACNTLQSLKDSIAGGDIVELEFEAKDSKDVAEALGNLEGTFRVTKEEENHLRAYVSMAEEWVPKMTNICYQKGVKVVSVRVTEPSLDDVFLHFTGRALGATAT
ncbi:ATP-binding cassette domain-containing protein [Candidatus Bathyarchaeota archaeon]|nr:ATP-binding cassette domain-containing protein [Candidatus Bathyarchaeota archaeon]